MGLFDWVRPKPARRFSGPAGARAYAIGDIHGHLDLLEILLDRILADVQARPSADIILVFLGDYIDRGPRSAEVIERVRTFADFPATVVCLMGNHEDILLRALAGEPEVAYDWLSFGGDTTAASYGLSAQRLERDSETGVAAALEAAVPPNHSAFLRSLQSAYRFGDYLFVHAGIKPGIPIDEQEPHDMMWIRDEFLPDRRQHEAMIVHGHTISLTVDEQANRIGIDTGAYRSGVLTALAVEGEERWFIDTAQP